MNRQPQHTLMVGTAGPAVRSGATVALVLVSLLVLTSCDHRQSGNTPVVLAEVDGNPITEATYRHWWGEKQPTGPNARRELLDQLIDRTAISEQARKAGIADDPAVVEAIESILIARLKEQQLQPQLAAASVTDAEVRDYYAAHAAEFQSTAKVHAAVLWFNTRGQSELEARYVPRLEQARELITSGVEAPAPTAGFGNLSTKFSEHAATRFKGGSLGWLSAGESHDAFRNTVMDIAQTLEPGQVSEVVVNEHGAFLVRLLETQSAGAQPFEQVEPQIRRDLLVQKRATIEREFLAGIRNAAKVTVHQEKLAALTDLPAPEQYAGADSPEFGGPQ